MANSTLESSASFDDAFSDDDDEAPSSSPCCCLPSLRRDTSAQSHLLRRKREEEGGAAEEESFVVRCAKKAREVSEVVAGPKWKNFVRSFSKKKRQEFRYDPESYALNFNDGVIEAEPERPEFSGRYADPLGMSKR